MSSSPTQLVSYSGSNKMMMLKQQINNLKQENKRVRNDLERRYKLTVLKFFQKFGLIFF